LNKSANIMDIFLVRTYFGSRPGKDSVGKHAKIAFTRVYQSMQLHSHGFLDIPSFPIFNNFK
jgi:hypothetical protein